MKYQLRLGPKGFDVIDTETNTKFNKEPISSKSKAKALIRTLMDKKNENKETRGESMYMNMLRRNTD
tara:strand:+ start:270 stop:470 length:201 start_codon:yes stop_codon:yes gene_type:complete